MRLTILLLLINEINSYSYTSSYNTDREYNIGYYGWKPTTRSGIGIDTFSGGTKGSSYQYQTVYENSNGQRATITDFGRLDSRDIHPDYNYMNPNWDLIPGPAR